jgi:hypothetical protein
MRNRMMRSAMAVSSAASSRGDGNAPMAGTPATWGMIATVCGLRKSAQSIV